MKNKEKKNLFHVVDCAQVCQRVSYTAPSGLDWHVVPNQYEKRDGGDSEMPRVKGKLCNGPLA